MENDADIKTEVRHAYESIKDFIYVQHVHAHQDEKNSYDNLSNTSKLNVLMDKYAAYALQIQTKVKHR